jgi:hypothetical protein
MAEGLSLWLPAAVSAAGAVAGFAVWSRPAVLKVLALAVSLASLALLVASPGAAAGVSLPMLLPIAACLSLLGQPAHTDNRAAWILTLLLLGLGLSMLTVQDGMGLILSALLLIVLVALLHRYRALSISHLWQGIGIYAFGVVCLVLGLVASPPVSAMAGLSARCCCRWRQCTRGTSRRWQGCRGICPPFWPACCPCSDFTVCWRCSPICRTRRVTRCRGWGLWERSMAR